MSTTRPDDSAVLGTFVIAASGLSLGAGLLTGTSYTCFRLWQLRVAADDLAVATPTRGRRAAAFVVRGNAAFWTANLGVLAANLRPLTRRSST